jgi:hypothetical protein
VDGGAEFSIKVAFFDNKVFYLRELARINKEKHDLPAKS